MITFDTINANLATYMQHSKQHVNNWNSVLENKIVILTIGICKMIIVNEMVVTPAPAVSFFSFACIDPKPNHR
jgi:hypothetical protein